MTMRFTNLRRFLTFAALLVMATVLFGQATDSTLVGSVSDGTGATVPNASITATNKDTGVKYTSITNAIGEYRINNVPVGRYDVSASAPGFSTATLAGAELQLNKTSTVNVVLQIGTVTTALDVQDAAVALDTTTAQLQNSFDQRQAIDLPAASSGSGILNLSLLGAGVASSGGVGYGSGPSIGGQRPTNNNFNIDGVDNNSHDVTGPLAYLSNEAVGQFTVLQNQFSAEFGGSSGGIFNSVIKSGTNQIHGALYEYLQNRNLNAVDALQVHQGLTSNPRFDSNRLGATIGGPILKNKLFYFGNFEYQPIGQSATPGQQVLAPTTAGYATLAGLPGVSKTNLSILQQYLPGVATASDTTPVAGVNIPIGPVSIVSPNFSNSYNAVAGIDYNMSDKDQLRGRYIYNKTSFIDTSAALPVFFASVPNVVHLISLSEFHNFSPTMENEFRASFSRRNNNYPVGDFKFPGLDAFPNIQIDQDLGLQLGPDPNSPQGYIQNQLQGSDNLTKTLGKHTIKAGYSFVDVIASNTFIQRSRGDYDYSTLSQYILDLTPDELAQRSVGAAGGIPAGFLMHSAFVNDDFRIRPNLTLNLGVRYEYVTTPVVSRAQQYSALADLPGVITFRNPEPSKTDFSPRIGFAWSPGSAGVWSIRGGFGRSFDNTYNNLGINAKPSFYQITKDADINSNAPNFLANGGLSGAVPPPPTTVAAARGQISSYTYDGTRPYALNYTLSVQRLLGKDYTLEARYVGTKGVHLFVQDQINKSPLATFSNNIPTYLATPSAATLAALPQTLGDLKAGGTANTLKQYGFVNNITAYHPIGNSQYNGLQLQMTKRYSQNFSYIAAYTWSHAIDDSTATVFSTVLTPRRGEDFRSLANDRSSSALDRRHRLTLSPIYDWKPFRDSNYLLKNVVGNWLISGTYTFESPEYTTIQSGVDSNLNGDNVDRAIVNPSGVGQTGSDVVALNRAGQVVAAGNASIVAYVAKDATAKYIKAQSGAFPNGGRNTFPLGHINNLDASLTKRINLTERMHFDIGGQFYNLFNHSQFIAGYLNDVAPRSFTTSRNFLIPGNAQFGQYDQFLSSNSRAIQIVARFVF